MKNWIQNEINTFIANYKKNHQLSTSWKLPLIGYANANDELFLRLKETISPIHFTPRELLDNAQTVIAYFLPFEDSIGKNNRDGQYPSKIWTVAYIETNRMIQEINRYLTQIMKDNGYECASVPPTHNFDQEKLLSAWSHKHIGYIAGLGHFGLHQMLITEEGSCGRLGSLVTSASLESTPRKSQETCLYKYNQTCRVCIDRCPTSALTIDAFDRHTCFQHLIESAKLDTEYESTLVCGKCVCIVPCSFTNPVASKIESAQK